MNRLFFDDALEKLVQCVASNLGADALSKGMVLRDSTGQLSFVSASVAPDGDRREQLAERFSEALVHYGRLGRTLLFSDDPGAQSILNSSDHLRMRVGDYSCNLVDRRIVGSGWLMTPVSTVSSPPRVVFASLKGGVGRSTALAITAFDLAARGKNVLVFDLDMEAPGIGDLLLTDDRMPCFGVVDYLVENGIGSILDTDLADFVGVSQLTSSSGGRVDVVPALGTRSFDVPENVLPKLARAMIEDISHDGEIKSVGIQISEMIDRLASREAYDVILVDSRAGLAELAAPAVLGLGALVLLFGTAQKQTIVGYRALFAGLNLLATRAVERGDSLNWRYLFKPVYAKAGLDPSVNARHLDDLYDLFSENLYDEDDERDDSMSYRADDPDAPHSPLVILFDPRFVDFDPMRNQDHLTLPFYEQTFRPFLKALDRALRDMVPGTE